MVSLKTSFDFLASIHSHLYYTLLWVSACFKCVFFCFSFNTCAFRRLFPVLAVFSISTTTPFFPQRLLKSPHLLPHHTHALTLTQAPSLACALPPPDPVTPEGTAHSPQTLLFVLLYLTEQWWSQEALQQSCAFPQQRTEPVHPKQRSRFSFQTTSLHWGQEESSMEREMLQSYNFYRLLFF